MKGVIAAVTAATMLILNPALAANMVIKTTPARLSPPAQI
jgi:hypothetical protein